MQDDYLGLDCAIGDAHYRAYIGPPDEYDLVSAMTFSLLVACGLRQHHRVLDIGCGSLRLGRLLIPYLNQGNYYGLEPNAWLVEDGVRYEIGESILHHRQPTFVYDTSLSSLESSVCFDYMVAQSIFSHTAPDLLEDWIRTTHDRLTSTGVMLATVIEGSTECRQSGWVYPECVEYRLDEVADLCRKHKLKFSVLDWYHPRQTWCAIHKSAFAVELLNNGRPSWNHFGAIRLVS